MIKSILPCLAALLLTTSVAHSASFSRSTTGPTPPAATASFGANVGPVADTCTSSDRWGLCDIDKFIAKCDEVGGGLSKEPGGGIECNTDTWSKN